MVAHIGLGGLGRFVRYQLCYGSARFIYHYFSEYQTRILIVAWTLQDATQEDLNIKHVMLDSMLIPFQEHIYVPVSGISRAHNITRSALMVAKFRDI